jgi:hypothetical protein
VNARITAKQKLTNKEQKELDAYIRTRAMEIYNEEALGLMRRCHKIMAVGLNEVFGFGKARIIKLFDRTSNLAQTRKDDEIFWEHIDDIAIKQIGIEFERENYTELEE